MQHYKFNNKNNYKIRPFSKININVLNSELSRNNPHANRNCWLSFTAKITNTLSGLDTIIIACHRYELFRWKEWQRDSTSPICKQFVARRPYLSRRFNNNKKKFGEGGRLSSKTSVLFFFCNGLQSRYAPMTLGRWRRPLGVVRYWIRTSAEHNACQTRQFQWSLCTKTFNPITKWVFHEDYIPKFHTYTIICLG